MSYSVPGAQAAVSQVSAAWMLVSTASGQPQDLCRAWPFHYEWTLRLSVSTSLTLPILKMLWILSSLLMGYNLCMCVSTCRHTCVEAGGEPQVLFLRSQGLLLTWFFPSRLGWLGGEYQGFICLSLVPQCWNYKSVPPCPPLYIALGVELRFLGLQGKHFTDGAIFPALVFFKKGSL